MLQRRVSLTSRALRACLSGTRPYPRIDSGVVIAERLQLPGTPTVIVNGWRFSRTPSASQLTRVIEDLLAGKEPELAP